MFTYQYKLTDVDFHSIEVHRGYKGRKIIHINCAAKLNNKTDKNLFEGSTHELYSYKPDPMLPDTKLITLKISYDEDSIKMSTALYHQPDYFVHLDLPIDTLKTILAGIYESKAGKHVGAYAVSSWEQSFYGNPVYPEDCVHFLNLENEPIPHASLKKAEPLSKDGDSNTIDLTMPVSVRLPSTGAGVWAGAGIGAILQDQGGNSFKGHVTVGMDWHRDY